MKRNAPLKPSPFTRKSSKMKASRPKMTLIRASARGQDCTLRFTGICNRNPETVVLCHRNGAGMGMKAPDTDACYGCSSCHPILDGHAPRPTWLTRDLMLTLFDEAVRITQEIVKHKGLMK